MGRMFGSQPQESSARAKARLVPLVLAGLVVLTVLPMAAFGKGGGGGGGGGGGQPAVAPAPAAAPAPAGGGGGGGGAPAAAFAAATAPAATGTFASPVRQAAFAAGLDSLAHVTV